MTDQDYKVTTSIVYGGFDLIIAYKGEKATLFIQDKEQAAQIADRIITLSIDNKIGINAAFSIFNQGSGMFGS